MFFLMAWSVAAMTEIPVCRIRLPAGFLSKLIQQAYWVDVGACLEFQIIPVSLSPKPPNSSESPAPADWQSDRDSPAPEQSHPGRHT